MTPGILGASQFPFQEELFSGTFEVGFHLFPASEMLEGEGTEYLPLLGLVPARVTIGCSAPADPPATEAPAVATNRYLSLVPGNAGQKTALRVDFTDLPAPYDIWNEVQMWVGPPVEYCENSGQDLPPPDGCGPAPGQTGSTFFASTLQCDPVFWNWQGVCSDGVCFGGMRDSADCVADVDCEGTVHVFHEGIIPSGGMAADPDSLVPATYAVQAVDGCDITEEVNYTVPLMLTSSKWGDSVRDCTTPHCSPPDGRVDVITDVTALVNKFKNLSVAPSQARTDLLGSFGEVLVDQQTSLLDMTSGIDAFQGLGYPPGALPPPGGRPCDQAP